MAMTKGDGHSFAIAGLMSDSVRSQIDRLPFLGHIPVLGALFRSTSWQRQETELLVIVTARMARPVAPHQVPPRPTDRELNDPGNIELFLLGWDSQTANLESERGSAQNSGGGPSGQVVSSGRQQSELAVDKRELIVAGMPTEVAQEVGKTLQSLVQLTAITPDPVERTMNRQQYTRIPSAAFSALIDPPP